MIKISADPLSSQTPQVTEARWASPIAGCVRAFLLAFCLLLPARAVERVALVIGNQAYQHVNPLRNPGNDARAVAEALKKANFTVIQGADLGNQALSGKVEEFRLAARGASSAFFYFSGHGLESKGLNYLVPVDADLTAEYQIKAQTLGVEQVLGAMDEAGVKLKMVVLDCCRNNPFKGWRTTRGGLAAPQEMPSGTVMMFAAASGNVAQDGKGANSPFASALTKAMLTPGLDLVKVFQGTGASVRYETEGQQEPWMNFNFYGDFYFLPGVPNAPLPEPTLIPRPPTPTPAAQPQAGESLQASNGMKLNWVAPMHGWAGVYEVTQEQYEKVMGNNPSSFKGRRKPVESVTWDEAMEYCRKLTEQDRAQGRLAEGMKYSLPSDDQWSVLVGDASLEDAVTSVGGRRSSTEEVGSKGPNQYGLYDTRGNVWEWCLDWYDDSIRAKDSSPSDIESGRKYRVLRGGSWLSLGSSDLAVSCRRFSAPAIRRINYGFRCVVVGSGG